MAKSTTKSNKSEKVSKKETKKVESSSESSSSSSSESSSSSSSSESESSSEDESSSSEEEEEEKKEDKTAKVSSSESSSDSDSSSSSSSSEEEEKKEEKKESSSESSSESESSSDSDSSSSEEEKEEETSSKRKAEEEVAEPAAKKQNTGEAEEPATLFVGRLSWSIDDEWLKREFEPIGGVIGARVMFERDSGRSRGYGYVDFESKAFAQKAIDEMQGKEIDGRPINLDMSTSKPKSDNNGADRAKRYGDAPSQPSDTLFLGNLSFNADRDALFESFSQFGSVVSVRLPTHPDTQQPKGFGYVQFSSIDEAKAAFEGMQGQYFDNRPMRVDYSAPRDNNQSGGFGGRGGARGGFGGRGGRGGARGGARGGRGGFSSGSNRAPLGGAFQGTKKSFD